MSPGCLSSLGSVHHFKSASCRTGYVCFSFVSAEISRVNLLFGKILNFEATIDFYTIPQRPRQVTSRYKSHLHQLRDVFRLLRLVLFIPLILRDNRRLPRRHRLHCSGSPDSCRLRRPYRGLPRPERPGTSVRTAAGRHSSVFPCRS